MVVAGPDGGALHPPPPPPRRPWCHRDSRHQRLRRRSPGRSCCPRRPAARAPSRRHPEPAAAAPAARRCRVVAPGRRHGTGAVRRPVVRPAVVRRPVVSPQPPVAAATLQAPGAGGTPSIIDLASTIPKGVELGRAVLRNAPLPPLPPTKAHYARRPCRRRPVPCRPPTGHGHRGHAPGPTTCRCRAAPVGGAVAGRRLPGPLHPPAGRGGDSGWIQRRLLVALDRADAGQHQQLYRAVGALHPEAVDRLAAADVATGVRDGTPTPAWPWACSPS